MKLISFLFRSLFFAALTFVFLVIFQYGPADFASNAQKELNYWTGKIGNPTPEN